MEGTGAFSVGGTSVGAGRVLVIGEVAQAHDGSLGMAHAFIDAIASAGADAVKFQTHIADAESTLQEPFRVLLNTQDASRYEYWKRMEFSEKHWRELAAHARARRLLFLSSPFSLEAVELLVRVGVPAWKIASGEVSNTPMIERILETPLPLLLSTGMSSMSEIDAVVSTIRQRVRPFAVMQCTSVYPCPPEQVGLNLIGLFRQRYGCPIGLSDHSGTIYPGLAATTLGADLLEVHITLGREMFGPDVPVSLTSGELRQLVEGVRLIERMRQSPVDKDALLPEVSPSRQVFFKSVVAKADLPAGVVVSEHDLTTKKPGTGIPASRMKELVGRRLRRNVVTNQLLHEEDFTS